MAEDNSIDLLKHIIDFEEALEMYGSKEIFKKCLESYAKTYIESFIEVHGAWRSQDVLKCEKAAHKFKGATMYPTPYSNLLP